MIKQLPKKIKISVTVLINRTGKSAYVSHSRLITCLQLRSAPSPLRHALRNASLDKKTSVEYNSVSLQHKHWCEFHNKYTHPGKKQKTKKINHYNNHYIIISTYRTFTTPINSLDTKRNVNAFRKKVNTRNITWIKHEPKDAGYVYSDLSACSVKSSYFYIQIRSKAYLKQDVVRCKSWCALEYVFGAHDPVHSSQVKSRGSSIR